MDLAGIQQSLRRQNLDAWLFFDHHGRDPLAYKVLGMPQPARITRRWYYLIPAEGDPIGLVHRIESGVISALPGEKLKYQGAEHFKKAYRYVVDRVRAKGATNIQWVYHLMDYSYPQEFGNYAADYYPGTDYVDWLGLSIYGEQFQKEPWAVFLPLLEWPYKEICALDPGKPVMLAEWGCGEFPGKGSKAQWIRDGFDAMKTKFPRIKAAIYWQERWQNSDGSFSNLRVNSSMESLDEYRKGVADPRWLERPILQPRERKPGS